MKVFDVLKSFFKKLFKNTIQAQIDIILPIAEQAVKQIADDPSIITNEEKRQRAMNMIIAELTAKEVVFAKRLINLCIEIAVVELKGIE